MTRKIYTNSYEYSKSTDIHSFTRLERHDENSSLYSFNQIECNRFNFMFMYLSISNLHNGNTV